MQLFSKPKKQLTYINLFSGIGCWEHGFEGLPLENVLSCEIDKHARTTFLANFSHLPSVKAGRYHDDILTLNPTDIPDFDILVGSPPCQSFSSAGKRGGLLEKSDNKGEMFLRVLDILRVKKPKAFILENVKGLLNAEGGKSFKVIHDLFKGAGYSFHYKVIKGNDCGIPQMRQRVFMVGFLHEDQEQSTFQFPAPVPLKYTLKDIFKCKTIDREIGHTVMTTRYNKNYGEPYNFSVYLVDGKEHRITVPEIKMLMGLPVDFKMPVSENQQKKQLGNGIIPDCGRLVMLEVLKHLRNGYKEVYSIFRK